MERHSAIHFSFRALCGDHGLGWESKSLGFHALTKHRQGVEGDWRFYEVVAELTVVIKVLLPVVRRLVLL
jgi:hypothetical protein